jgi:hypothetical protein
VTLEVSDPPARPRAAPDWEAAAQRLVSALRGQPDDDARSRLLERVATRVGGAHYLAFIQLLCAVQHFGDTNARRGLAEALAGALARHRLPAGPIPAWGASSLPANGPGSGLLYVGHASGARRLGPIEFLCASLTQSAGGAGAAPDDDVAFALRCVIELVGASPRAVDLYTAQLVVDADDPLQGTLNRRTRDTLRAIAGLWRAGESPERIVRRGLAAGRSLPV